MEDATLEEIRHILEEAPIPKLEGAKALLQTFPPHTRVFTPLIPGAYIVL